MSITVPAELEATDLLQRIGCVAERLFPADTAARERVRVHIDAVRFHLLAIVALVEGEADIAAPAPRAIAREPASWWHAVDSLLQMAGHAPCGPGEERVVTGAAMTAEQAARRIMHLRTLGSPSAPATGVGAAA